MYITISPDIENTLNPSTTSFVVCDHQHEMEATYSCIDEQNLLPSLNLLKVLGSELQKRAVARKCQRATDISNIMCIKDFWHYLNDNQHQYQKYFQEHLSVLEVMKEVHNIEYLIDKNRHWGIQNVNSNGDIMSLDQVVNLRAHQAECFAILSPKLPLTCTLYNKIQTFFTIIGTIAIILILAFGGRKFYNFVLHVKEKRRAQINHIVSEIIRLLMEKTITDKDNAYLILPHLRDKILENRKSELLWAWQEAVTYLENNDSRVQFGVENINGEDFRIIRLMDDIKNLNASSMNNSFNIQQQQQQQQHQQQLSQQQSQQRFTTNGNRYSPPPVQDVRLKRWMCPAFDKSNKIKDAPTNCLKIRQMFDKYEVNSPNLQSIIQDTILHKVCEKGCKVYDIQLDLKTCCTYVKCESSDDARIVHEEINGWWLDNRLVVVKFLKEDKYHQRFPSSMNANALMYPSASYTIAANSFNGNNGHDNFGDDCDFDDEDNDEFE
jgi:membrane protein Man1